jgi:hypothetical protein
MPLLRKAAFSGLAVLMCALLAAAPARAQPVPGAIGDERTEPEAAHEQLQVYIHGNDVLLDSVLLWILDMPEQGPATEAMAERAEQRLESLFVQTGYDLARVRALVYEEQLHVFVDEGHLERVFFTGSGLGQALRLQIDLELPGDVYNRRQIEREIARLEAKYELDALRAELIVLEPEPATLVQLEDFVAALDDEASLASVWRQNRGRYALRIHVVTPQRDTGLNVGVAYLPPWGLRSQVGYAGSELLFEDDRYRATTQVALLRDWLLTEAQSDLSWTGPAVVESLGMRPGADLHARLANFEHRTLGLERFLQVELSALANLRFELTPDFALVAGLGYGYDELFDLQRTDRTPDYVVGEHRHYPLIRFELDWEIDRIGFRRGTEHQLQLLYDVLLPQQGLVQRFDLHYQNVWEFGFQDLFARARAMRVEGEGAHWRDERPIASPIVRAVSGPEEFAKTMSQAGLEYRVSLHRDILKLSASAGLGAGQLIERDTRTESLAFFASGGPGVHVLLLDNFQVDVYYSVGVPRQGDIGQQVTFSIIQAY